MALPMLDERQVREQPYQPAPLKSTAGPETFGAGVGQALGEVGGQFTKIALEEKQKADAFAAADLDAQFSAAATDLLYNGKTGFLHRQGSAALDTAPVQAEFDKLQQRIAQQAKTVDQQRAFMARTIDRRDMLTRQMEAHSGQQRQKYYAETADGQASQAINDAALFYNRPEDVAQTVEHVLPLLRLQWAGNEQLPPEQIMKREQAFKADVQTAVMKMYLAKDQGLEGIKYLNSGDVRQQLGTVAADIEARLRPIADHQVGEVAAEQAFQESFGTVESLMNVPSYANAQSALRKMADGKFTVDQYKAASDGLRTRFSAWQEGYRMDGDTLVDTARAAWTQGGYSLFAIPPHVQDELTARGEWYKMVDLDRNWHNQKTPPTTEQKRSMVSFALDLAKNPQTYDAWDEKTFYARVGHLLHKDDLEQAALMLARVQGRPERWSEGLKPILQMMDQMGASKEINAFPQFRDKDPKKRDVMQWEDQNQVNVYYEAQRRVQQWLVDWHKKPHTTATPTMEEYRPFLEELWAKGKDPDGGWFSQGTATTRVQADVLGTGFEPAGVAPPEFERQLRARWPAYAGPLTQDVINQTWVETVGRRGKNPTKDELKKQMLEAEAARQQAATLMPGP